MTTQRKEPVSLTGIRKCCVIMSMGLSALVVISAQVFGREVQEGVPQILGGMNTMALAVYGVSKTVERVWGRGDYYDGDYHAGGGNQYPGGGECGEGQFGRGPHEGGEL